MNLDLSVDDVPPISAARWLVNLLRGCLHIGWLLPSPLIVEAIVPATDPELLHSYMLEV